ncbi:hypothetical protein BN1221_04788c [Brenneria goodwinii]|uniref:Uncharacterized protein n=1 Tax=Brenneria goodwinii TaxID=1109412 RepID=A0A0G4K2W3_9GAMM|nr:hypothetical protein BN1221_04788c [Brenneria goodwinii]
MFKTAIYDTHCLLLAVLDSHLPEVRAAAALYRCVSAESVEQNCTSSGQIIAPNRF